MRTPENWVETPKHLKYNKGLVNLKNWNQNSLICCILRGLFSVEKGQPQRYSSDLWKKEGMYHWGEDSLPISERIDFIETWNDISLNVFSELGRKIFPLRLTKERKSHHVNLFWLSGTKHFCLITSMSRLFSKQNKQLTTTFYCRFCMKKSVNEKIIEAHELKCENMKKSVFD